MADSTADPTADPQPGGPTGPDADITQLSYEQARDELIDIVNQLESGKVGLAESMDLWQRGETLAAHCTTWLDDAESRLSGGALPAAGTDQSDS